MSSTGEGNGGGGKAGGLVAPDLSLLAPYVKEPGSPYRRWDRAAFEFPV